jgi:hypothetical protein
MRSLGNSGVASWGRLVQLKKLYWAIFSGLGSGYGVRVTSATGNVYAQTYSTTHAFNKNGNSLWQKSLSAGNIYTLSTDTSENVYISGPGRALVAKFNSIGSIQWQRYLSASNAYDATNFADTSSSGDTYLAGSRTPVSDSYGTIAKIDSTGAAQWSFVYSSTLYPLAVAYNSSATTVGVANTIFGSPYTGVFVVHSAADGSIQWQRSITSSGQNVILRGVAADSSGNYYVGAFLGGMKAVIIKFNSTGTVQWQKQITYSTVWNLASFSPYLSTDSSGNLYASFYQEVDVTGSIASTGFMKFDSAGNLLFARRLTPKSATLQLHVASDSTVTLMGVDILAKLKGDGSGLGTYDGFTYNADSVSTYDTGTVTVSASGYSISSAGFSATASSFTVTNGTATPVVSYIGTEVG